MIIPIDREEVMKIIKLYGPLQPLEVKRRLGKGDTMIIGATLSELAHNGRVSITDLKRGSSPFYYDPQKPETLERISQYLGEKDKRTYELLKKKRAVISSKLEPLTRVSLSQIKDYAKPFKVIIDGHEELCYRHYLVSEDEAKLIVLGVGLTGADRDATTPVTRNSNLTEKKIINDKVRREDPSVRNYQKNNNKEQKIVKSAKASEEGQKLTEYLNDQIITDDPLIKIIKKYCEKRKIKIRSYKIIRKGTEADLTLLVPTAVGKAEYYCKAKSKKRSNDGDIASALLSGQLKRLPVIYLTTGEVTKKAEEMTKKEFKGVIIKKIRRKDGSTNNKSAIGARNQN